MPADLIGENETGPAMLRFFIRISDGISTIAMWLSMAIGALMMLHIAADVTSRHFFGGSLFGTIEIVSGYYMVAITFLPLAWLVGREGHIFVELFTRHMRERSLLRLETIVIAITIAYVAILAWQSILNALEQTERREQWETALGFVAMWPSRWLLAIGFVCLAAQFIAQLVIVIARLRGNEAVSPK
jgi:TRAP-type C4-dicarboxylate transport system permease small subunit